MKLSKHNCRYSINAFLSREQLTTVAANYKSIALMPQFKRVAMLAESNLLERCKCNPIAYLIDQHLHRRINIKPSGADDQCGPEGGGNGGFNDQTNGVITMCCVAKEQFPPTANQPADELKTPSRPSTLEYNSTKKTNKIKP